MSGPATEPAELVRREARITTAHASRYLQQLCKHFAHKRPVSFDERAGRIEFTIGDCRLAADDEALTLRLEAPDEAQLEQLQDVVIRHLERFAFRESLAVRWKAA
ncbi:hypothetical protein GCM10011390_04770 [Aureimonas endophytica]|uniref:DUF2218 domain-containing protein n=1 Tax=Aureimonas endophytica TaxID=2027858 RepID=A0A916ZCQ4_9HYPH|nr:DUF2218 domain-containing protein [Aureimonas endophytica]GGD89065.1 hypothetical protein GCM10011390_04770 [Aureimonas endophytica]